MAMQSRSTQWELPKRSAKYSAASGNEPVHVRQILLLLTKSLISAEEQNSNQVKSKFPLLH